MFIYLLNFDNPHLLMGFNTHKAVNNFFFLKIIFDGYKNKNNFKDKEKDKIKWGVLIKAHL